ncbi:MAG: helix-turn-helix transcriptional regulator [Planctomycetota bacterium]|jgi:predicted DNA-binding transcriptional regulator AlpA
MTFQDVSASPKELFDASALRKWLSVSRTTLHRLEKRADFPKPFMVGGAKRWDRNEIERWLSKQR